MSTATNPADLSATEAARLIAEGTITSRDVTAACLARIAERDPEVRAWSFIDPDYAMEQASAADAWRQEGRPPGRLHGVPVGVKDIFDTRDMPTEYGTPLAAGRRPSEDAAAVAKLRHAGAVIMGKTVTTELAVYSPNETRNPHDTGHTPGGSSSGSAAAVAAGMVPLALGSQTNGSVVRPASYCGVVGYKPSFGLISRRGVLAQSPPLDQIGVFARDVEDAALITDCLTGFDPGDRDSLSGARAPLCEVAGSELTYQSLDKKHALTVYESDDLEAVRAAQELPYERIFAANMWRELLGLGPGAPVGDRWSRFVRSRSIAV